MERTGPARKKKRTGPGLFLDQRMGASSPWIPDTLKL